MQTESADDSNTFRDATKDTPITDNERRQTVKQ